MPESQEEKKDIVKEKPKTGLSKLFSDVGGGLYNIWKNPVFEGGLIAATAGMFGSSLLLGTTVLTSPALLATAALIGLIKTSEIVSKRAENIGNILGLSPLIIGIGLGMITSLPELGVSMAGLLGGSPDIALGNGIGSNIANVGLIMGLCAIVKPLQSNDKNWWYDTAAMGLSTAFVMGTMATGALGMFSGVTMMGMLAAYFGGQYLLDKKKKADAAESTLTAKDEAEKAARGKISPSENTAEAEQEGPKPSMMKDIAWGAAGIAGLIGSASLLVTGGSAVALSLGVPASMVALFGFAVGTSLPELMVSMQAVFRGNSGMAIGNILGSNIFNNLFVIGMNNVVSLFHGAGEGIKVPAAFAWDNAMGRINNIAYGLSAALPAAFLTYNKMRSGTASIGRKQGILMAASYAAFAGAAAVLGGIGGEQSAAASGAAASVPPPVPVPA